MMEQQSGSCARVLHTGRLSPVGRFDDVSDPVSLFGYHKYITFDYCNSM